jgi:hypothetical protein
MNFIYNFNEKKSLRKKKKKVKNRLLLSRTPGPRQKEEKLHQTEPPSQPGMHA